MVHRSSRVSIIPLTSACRYSSPSCAYQIVTPGTRIGGSGAFTFVGLAGARRGAIAALATTGGVRGDGDADDHGVSRGSWMVMSEGLQVSLILQSDNGNS